MRDPLGCRACGAKSSSRFRPWPSCAHLKGFEGVEFAVPQSSVVCDVCHRRARRGTLKVCPTLPQVAHASPFVPLFYTPAPINYRCAQLLCLLLSLLHRFLIAWLTPHRRRPPSPAPLLRATTPPPRRSRTSKKKPSRPMEAAHARIAIDATRAATAVVESVGVGSVRGARACTPRKSKRPRSQRAPRPTSSVAHATNMLPGLGPRWTTRCALRLDTSLLWLPPPCRILVAACGITYTVTDEHR